MGQNKNKWIGLALAGLLAACNAPPPTLSPSEQATRLAQIPTAASLRPTETVRVAQANPATPTRVPEPATAAPAPATVAELPVGVPIEGGFANYVVKSGDTLSSVAFNFKVSMAAIQLANEMGESQVVKVGQTYKVPLSKTFPDEGVFWVVVVVKAGETLGGICVRNNVSLSDVIRINKLDANGNVRAGQALIMPINVPTKSNETTLAENQSTPPTPDKSAVAEVIPIVPIEPLATSTNPPQPAPTQAVVFVAPAVSNDVDAMRSELLVAYNNARAAEGLPPLAWSPVLQSAAQLHAQDCTQRGFGSHVGSDGANLKTRIARVGFAGNIAGENWAWARGAAQAFEMWFTQEYPDGPHRRNILSPRYTEVGFGIVQDRSGFYFIADLGAP